LVRARENTENSRNFPIEEDVAIIEAAPEEAIQSVLMAGLFEQVDGIRDPSFLEVGGPDLDQVRRITPVTVQEVSPFQAP